MTPSLAIFYKEFRQHFAIVPGIVALCFLFPAFVITANWYYDAGQIKIEFFLFTAFCLTVLYAGIAAALTYSTEHADKTFTFLRSLPVSLTMLAVGKIGWALCGTLLVLIGNLFVSVFLITMQGQAGTLGEMVRQGIFDSDIWIICSSALVQVFLWGLFWSTRCHRQMNAVLAGLASPAILLWAFAYIVEAQLRIPVPHNFYICFSLAQIALVGFFAFWGVFRWFHYDTRRSLLARLLLDHHIVLVRYPKRVQSPFFALVHQHIRHASFTYLFGILCFIVWSLGCIYLCCLSETARREVFDDQSIWSLWHHIGYLACLFGAFLFWGTIFGHDQRGDSYKFLTRLGVHPGTVWWSRMLPGFSLYVLAGLCFIGLMLVQGSAYNRPLTLEMMWQGGSMGLAVWLAPIAIGSLVSISFRSQALSVILTWIGTYAILLWGMNWLWRYEASPLWTTLPICITLLIASRIRAAYWLREIFTWRSHLIPLAPVLGAVLVIAMALIMISC